MTATFDLTLEVKGQLPTHSTSYFPFLHTNQVLRHILDTSLISVDIACTREVKYQERGEVPGLYVRKGSTMSSVT